MPTPEILLRGRRVLVAEDEYLLADELVQMLIAAGVRVLGPVPTVAAALGLLDAEALAPDLAVLDVKLADSLIYPVAAALSVRGTPFLFVSGYARAALPAAFAGVTLVQKPIAPEAILHAAAAALGRAALAHASRDAAPVPDPSPTGVGAVSPFAVWRGNR